MKVLVISVFLTAVAVSHGLSLVGLASQTLFNGPSAVGFADKIVSEGTKDVAAVANAIKGVVTGTKSASAMETESESCEESSSPTKTSSGLSTLLKMPTNLAASVADISKDVLQMPTNFAGSVADISNNILKVSTDLKAVSDGPTDLTTLLQVPANLASSMVDISKDVLKVSTDFKDSMVDISKDVVKAQTDFTDSMVNISKDMFKGQSDLTESMATISKDIIKVTSDLVSVPNDVSNITSIIKLPKNIAETVADLSKDFLKVPTNIAATLKNPRSAFVDVILKNFFDGLRKMIVKSIK